MQYGDDPKPQNLQYDKNLHGSYCLTLIFTMHFRNFILCRYFFRNLGCYPSTAHDSMSQLRSSSHWHYCTRRVMLRVFT